MYSFSCALGSMMTNRALHCFADQIRGAVQAGSGVKLHGKAVTTEWCEGSSNENCEVAVTDGNNVPGGAGSHDTCEYFPLQLAKMKNVVGEDLRWCIYAGCSDGLLGTIENMGRYLQDIGVPHNLQYSDGPHEAPDDWMSMVAECHGIWSGTTKDNSGISCSDLETE